MKAELQALAASLLMAGGVGLGVSWQWGLFTLGACLMFDPIVSAIVIKLVK
jgi:hypothetical protein